MVYKDRRPLIILLLILTFLLTIILTIYNIQHERDSPININTCSIEALESLPEIGKVLSRRIVQNRPYNDIYELSRVKGIGDKTIEILKNRVVTK